MVDMNNEQPLEGAEDQATVVETEQPVQVSVVETIEEKFKDDAKSALTKAEEDVKKAYMALHEIAERAEHWIVEGWNKEVVDRLEAAKAALSNAHPAAVAAAKEEVTPKA